MVEYLQQKFSTSKLKAVLQIKFYNLFNFGSTNMRPQSGATNVPSESFLALVENILRRLFVPVGNRSKSVYVWGGKRL